MTCHMIFYCKFAFVYFIDILKLFQPIGISRKCLQGRKLISLMVSWMNCTKYKAYAKKSYHAPVPIQYFEYRNFVYINRRPWLLSFALSYIVDVLINGHAFEDWNCTVINDTVYCLIFIYPFVMIQRLAYSLSKRVLFLVVLRTRPSKPFCWMTGTPLTSLNFTIGWEKPNYSTTLTHHIFVILS